MYSGAAGSRQDDAISSSSTSATLQPFETIRPKLWWKGLNWAQYADIWLVAVVGALVALILLALVLLVGDGGKNTGDVSEAQKILFGAFLAVVGGTAARFYDLANRRAGTIDMIASDIISTIRLIVALNILDDFMAKAKALQAEVDKGPASGAQAPAPAADAAAHQRGGTREQLGPGFADTARRSDYFAVFNALITDLRALDSWTVSHVTAFYTFLKGARDATESLERWKNTEYRAEWKINDIVAIIYAMNLCVIHGRCAIGLLVQDADIRQTVDTFLKGVIVKNVRFIDETIRDDHDLRWQVNRARIVKLCAEDETLIPLLRCTDPATATAAIGQPVTTPRIL
jgi:hypothetical protein